MISSFLFNKLKNSLPTISKTEQEALDAGTTWWDQNLFQGDINVDKLLSIPKCEMTPEETIFLDETVDTLCSMLDDYKINQEEHDLPPEVWTFLKDNNFFGLVIPKEYGGLDFSAYAHSQVVMKVASKSIAAAVTVMVPNSLGPGKLLLHYGTDEQKAKYLPSLSDGTNIPCFALTGPTAGSDAGSIPDNGVIVEKDGELGINLNWDKRYITLGPVATLLGLAFKLYDPNHLLGDNEDLGITVALIPTDTKGVKIGERHNPLGVGFMNGPNYGHDVFIPLSYIIGGKPMIGQGWRMLVECLSEGRSISLPSLSVAGAKLTSKTTGAYAHLRTQFNLPIGKFEGVKEKLAVIAGYTYMMDSARQLTLSGLDNGEKPSVISAIVKYELTERMRTIINHGMDIQGGSGICLGENNILGNVYQSIPVAITVEGANILTRSLIIFGQGSIRCHPFVLKEYDALINNDKKAFTSTLFKHAHYTIKNTLKTIYYGFGGSTVGNHHKDAFLNKHFKELQRMSTAFALLSDISLMTLGGALKRKEMLSGKFADILSSMYLMSATLKSYNDHKNDNRMRYMENTVVDWCCADLLYSMQESFYSILENYPNSTLGYIFKRMIFPFGRIYKKPSDKLINETAEALFEPSSLVRERLVADIYSPSDVVSKLGRLENAFIESQRFKNVKDRMKDDTFREMYYDIIKVDKFDKL